MEKEIASEKKEKPVYDEQTLADVLEAAYVLQEHNRGLKQAMESRVEPVRSGAPAKLTEESSEKPAETPIERLRPLLPDNAAPTNTAPEIPTAPPSKDDYTPTLAQIVETQHQIQMHHLELNAALSLVTERVTEIAHAGGSGVGIVSGKKLVYRAVAGLMTLPQGSEVPLEAALSVASLKTGHVIRGMHVNSEFLIDPEECRRRGIRSLITVPVYHDGGVAGALELYYAKAEAFTEQDVHTCQLMAGLITEALARADEVSWKKSLADERAVMLEALEKLKPNLAALLDASGTQKSTPKTSETHASETETKTAAALATGDSSSGASSAAAAAQPTFVCRKCGNQLLGEEQFCGKCGLPRGSGGDDEPPNMQSKVASLWHMQEAMRKQSNGTAEEDDEALAEALAASFHDPLLESSAGHEVLDHHAGDTADLRSSLDGGKGNAAAMGLEEISAEEPSQKIEHSADWSSAATARDFLERLASRPGSFARFWNARRGDIYLAIAVILVIVAIRWGIWSNHSVGASGNQYAAAAHRKPAADSDLSLFDRMLISLGLAEAPEPPESKGNPNTQVWVDLQTALYYCPGSDLYGKTLKGKFEAQRDAQLDQFESASRKACD
ncbi:MAG TPA: GAF domain-containing protein [Terriglobales bacterium]|nr:GAF domain-containing protein [Terriglobales bacterium]